MHLLDFNDKNLISTFFYEDGYILNFSDSTFESFTTHSVGFSVKDKYGLSKGKSFIEFVNKEPEKFVLKLTNDLIKYIECNGIKLNDLQKKQFPKLKQLVNKNSKLFNFSSNLTNKVINQFNNAFIENQMNLMLSLLSESPTDVIGKSKELVESCFKYILDENDIEYSNSDSLSNLQKKVFSLLNLNVNENVSAKSNDDVKRILNSFNQIIQGLNSLRNDKGDGHGKGKKFRELPKRYAELSMNSALTLIHFVWDTYEEQHKK